MMVVLNGDFLPILSILAFDELTLFTSFAFAKVAIHVLIPTGLKYSPSGRGASRCNKRAIGFYVTFCGATRRPQISSQKDVPDGKKIDCWLVN
jgi:hypothetical protein